MTPPRTNGPTTNRRRGFTLVELLVVILIMAILIALLVPAIAGAVKAANDARVSAEIQNMATALADFRSRYGEFPPSRIALYNSGIYNPSDPTAMSPKADVTLGDINARTSRAMKKYFPRAGGYFSSPGTTGASTMDWDGPLGSATGVILQGHECLVFFLGGMPEATTTGTYALSGFSKDPVNPFFRSGTVIGGVTFGTNRTTPTFEFSPSRLQDVFNITISGNSTAATGPNGFPSYLDPLSSTNSPRPYAYFSAYGNNGYDPNDDDSAGFGNVANGSVGQDSIEVDDSGVNPIFRTFYCSFPMRGGGNIATSTPPNPYTSGVADSTVVSNGTPQKLTWINPQSYQLISAGRDGLWGLGGTYDATSNNNRLPAVGKEANINGFAQLRTRERDNIANFAQGKLD